MTEAMEGRLNSLWADLAGGAVQAGEPPPGEEDVCALAALLRDDAQGIPVPSDLVPSLRRALVEAARPAHRRATPGLGSLLRLLWAEARFLPLSFLVLEATLLAVALVANRYLTGFAGPRIPSAWPAVGPVQDLVTRALLRDALGRTVDAFILVAPWLGTAVALFAVLPRRRGLWADLETLSPFPVATRLLGRVAVATLTALAGTVAVGLVHPGPAGAGAMFPFALPLLARAAPLFLAVAWALAWSMHFGAPGAAIASLALWGGLTWFGGRLGRWDLLALPGPGAPALAQLVALAAGAALFALVWAQARSLAPQRNGGSP